jgi:hypothetical protein
MFTIAGTRYTLSETADLIHNDDAAVWHDQYTFYLPKIERSGATNFANLTELIMKLANYCMKELSLQGNALARARGTALPANVAIQRGSILRGNVRVDDRAAIAHLMAGNADGNGVSNESQHTTDPETGKPKAQHVSVREYYINGAAGRRATKRTEGHKVTYYYSDNHAYNSYQYQLLR